MPALQQPLGHCCAIDREQNFIKNFVRPHTPRTEKKQAHFKLCLLLFVYRKPRHSGGVQKRLTDEQDKKTPIVLK